VHVPPSPRALCASSMGVGSDVWASSMRHGPRRAGVAPEPASLVGGLREQPVRAGQVAPRVRRAAKAAAIVGPVPISGWWPGNLKKSFSIFLLVSN
jgi:hypothetical protein